MIIMPSKKAIIIVMIDLVIYWNAFGNLEEYASGNVVKNICIFLK